MSMNTRIQRMRTSMKSSMLFRIREDQVCEKRKKFLNSGGLPDPDGRHRNAIMKWSMNLSTETDLARERGKRSTGPQGVSSEKKATTDSEMALSGLSKEML